MGTKLIPADVQWRKSSYSGDTGGQCIECAPLNGVAWRKSSYSSDTGGQCLEYAPLSSRIAVRDTKHPTLGHLTLTPATFTRFVGAAARGEL
ncbi:DUF397 domain-containing protein [Streptomyces sp. NPDC048182]|uniref:DUF397 domain-containing protein n=1 Tax=Streptomyces sp. NPDC048182 TaxID=3365507 RepID=UPI00371A3D1A